MMPAADPDRAAAPAWTIGDQGLILAVRITTKAPRDAIGAPLTMPDGRDALSIRIAAPPVDGAANAALIAFLGKALGVRKADVAIASGETSRLKILRIRGDGQRIAATLRSIVERAGSGPP